jgi:uncharacterized membrane protein
VAEDLSYGENVIAVTFEDGASAYEALTHLKELDSQEQIGLEGAAVVVRDEAGHIEVKDEVGDESYAGTATGGLVGLIIGILGGPFGILIGAATGVLVGSLFDLHEDEETESALVDLSKSVSVGQTSLLADVKEQGVEVIDTAMARLGGEVHRRSMADVKAEIAAAEKAQRKAKLEARKELIKASHEKHQHEIDAKIEELKAKLHPHEKAATAAS